MVPKEQQFTDVTKKLLQEKYWQLGTCDIEALFFLIIFYQRDQNPRKLKFMQLYSSKLFLTKVSLQSSETVEQTNGKNKNGNKDSHVTAL